MLRGASTPRQRPVLTRVSAWADKHIHSTVANNGHRLVFRASSAASSSCSLYTPARRLHQPRLGPRRHHQRQNNWSIQPTSAQHLLGRLGKVVTVVEGAWNAGIGLNHGFSTRENPREARYRYRTYRNPRFVSVDPPTERLHIVDEYSSLSMVPRGYGSIMTVPDCMLYCGRASLLSTGSSR